MGVVQIPKGQYTIYEGNFGLVRWGREKQYEPARPFFVEWYGCRDSFHYHFNHWRNDEKRFFYAFNRQRLQQFFDEVESSLNMVWRTQFYDTNIRGVCCIKPAKLWRNDKMLMSLFTILLRAGHRYHGGNNWLTCVYEHPYVHNTHTAVERFFAGKTVYTGCLSGWCQQFDTQIMKEENFKLDKLLIEPDSCSKFFKAIGLFIRRKVFRCR